MVEANREAGKTPGRSVHPATVLLRRLVQVTRDFEERLEQELTVNSTDLEAMQHLLQRGSLSPSELAEVLQLSPAATTTVVDRLESLGHATRSPHPTDRRRTVVQATDSSRSKAEGILWEMISSIDSVALRLDNHAQQVVVSYLDEVIRRYEEASAKTPTE